MPPKSRVRRPKSERSAPLRNSGFFKSAQAGAHESAADGNTVGDDVLDAYRVMEEQMRAGAFKAQQQNPLMGNMNNPGAAPPGTNGNFLSQWMGMYMQMFNTGMKAMENFADLRSAQSGPIPFPTESPQGQADAEVSRGNNSPVRFNLACNRPAQVSIDLRKFDAGNYQVQPLFSAEKNCPPIEGIELSEEADIFSISLDIPAEQPDGIYMGAIVLASDNTACGTITVKL